MREYVLHMWLGRPSNYLTVRCLCAGENYAPHAYMFKDGLVGEKC